MKPSISVIVPCRNEVRTISELLDDIAAQGVAGLTVVVADGRSNDGTWELLCQRASAGRDPFYLLPVENPDGTIPQGLNRAVEAAPEGIIIRLDAHGRIGPGYLQSIADALGDRRDLLVGPRIVMVPGGRGAMAEAIAAVLNSPVGNGGTPSRRRIGAARPVSHTVMSCWHRTVWEGLGGYDESLLSNEDFAFDWVARCRGCSVLSLPEPVYRLEARASLASLVRQRWRYGWWKAVVLRRHPRSLHLRQLLPLAELLLIAPLAIWAPLWLAVIATIWLAMVWAVAMPVIWRAGAMRPIAAALLAPLVTAVVQLVWAAGLFSGLVLNHPGQPRPGARTSRDAGPSR